MNNIYIDTSYILMILIAEMQQKTEIKVQCFMLMLNVGWNVYCLHPKYKPYKPYYIYIVSTLYLLTCPPWWWSSRCRGCGSCARADCPAAAPPRRPPAARRGETHPPALWQSRFRSLAFMIFTFSMLSSSTVESGRFVVSVSPVSAVWPRFLVLVLVSLASSASTEKGSGVPCWLALILLLLTRDWALTSLVPPNQPQPCPLIGQPGSDAANHSLVPQVLAMYLPFPVLYKYLIILLQPNQPSLSFVNFAKIHSVGINLMLMNGIYNL